MDLRKIKKLIELVEESGIAELEVKSGEEAVRISMSAPASAAPVAVVSPVANRAVPNDEAVDAAGSPTPAAASADAAAALAASRSQPGTPLNAPLSGTFYLAPAPDAEPFVQVGDQVRQGDVLCIVESMKMMNRIEADRSGSVTAVLVPNGEPVEAGQALFLLDSGA